MLPSFRPPSCRFGRSLTWLSAIALFQAALALPAPAAPAKPHERPPQAPRAVSSSPASGAKNATPTAVATPAPRPSSAAQPVAEPQAPSVPLVLAPEASASGPDGGAWLGMAAVAGLSAGALLGLALWDGGEGALSRIGPLGQLAFVGAVATVPPAALVQWREGGFSLDGTVAALSGGLGGLGLGYAATRSLGGQTPSPGARAIQAAAMAVGQGLGAATGYQLYRAHQPFDPEWNRLPEKRTDDPIENWNLQRERKHP